MTVLEHALRYAANQIRIIPIRPGGKSPGIKNWTTLATSNPDTIRNWYEGPYKDWGVGIVTGRAGDRQFFVLDVDEHDPQQFLRGRSRRGGETDAGPGPHHHPRAAGAAVRSS